MSWRISQPKEAMGQLTSLVDPVIGEHIMSLFLEYEAAQTPGLIVGGGGGLSVRDDGTSSLSLSLIQHVVLVFSFGSVEHAHC
jgi:hypothetical protein